MKIGTATAIVCSRRRKSKQLCSVGKDRDRCPNPARILCDFPVGPDRTCDMPVCTAHAREVGPDRHFCPLHKTKEPS